MSRAARAQQSRRRPSKRYAAIDMEVCRAIHVVVIGVNEDLIVLLSW